MISTADIKKKQANLRASKFILLKKHEMKKNRIISLLKT